jgi:hypothetical protein
MQAAPAVHDEVLCTAIEAHEGFLFSHFPRPAATDSADTSDVLEDA